MNCCLQKVLYDLQESVGDRQYTIILIISIIILFTILNYVIDRERSGAPLFLVGFLRPQCPPPDATILNYFNDRDGGRQYFCRILAPPPPHAFPSPSPGATILDYLNDRERGRHYLFGILVPPPPNPDATILNPIQPGGGDLYDPSL